MTKPLVSVIMPVYNCENYLRLALDSITNQTYKNLEIIVVDDCSSDNSWEIIKEYEARDDRIKAYKNKENSKIVATMNFAISKSTGKYLARMDGDDEKVSDSIESQVAFMEKNEDVVVVGGTVEICDEEMNTLNNRSYLTTDREIRSKIFRFSPFAHAAIMMRAQLVPNEPYKLNWAEDYDLYFRLGALGKFANLEKTIYRVRTHKQSVSRTKARHQENLTLYIRLKAVFEYGYKMKASDKWYFFMQLISMYMMPVELRFWLFNKIRKVL